jgi:hypothetical protein
MENFGNIADQYRARAVLARETADRIRNEEVRRQLLDIAAAYDAMADQAKESWKARQSSGRH